MVGVGSTGGGPLAFVLDDETAVATMICKQLTMLGMEACPFSDPIKFFTSLKVSRPKLVVLDLALGKSDAVEVTHPRCAIHLATALRLLLIEVASAKRAAVGKNEKMEILYAYLSGIEFRQRVDAIVEAFVTMQEDLQEERRSTERRWAKREKTIQRVISNTSGMYGDLQGLVGSSLATIPTLTSDMDCAEVADSSFSSKEATAIVL